MKNWISKKLQETGIADKVSGSKEWVSEKLERSEFVEKMQEKVSESKDWVSEKLDTSEVYMAMQKNLSEKIEGEFEATIQRKKEFYETHPSKAPALENVDLIIKTYVLKNAGISGGASLVPGPWGMVAVVPEIALVIRNQIEMVYDIGVANGKGRSINKELLAGIFLSAMGAGLGGLLVMHGSKVLVKRSSLRIFQKIIALLAGKITQHALKSAISKWLPIVGAAFMAWLSGYLTKNIAQKANDIFKKEIEFTDLEVEESDVMESDRPFTEKSPG